MSIAAVNSGTFPTLPVTLQQIMSFSICESIVSGQGEYPSVSTITIFGIGFRDSSLGRGALNIWIAAISRNEISTHGTDKPVNLSVPSYTFET